MGTITEICAEQEHELLAARLLEVLKTSSTWPLPERIGALWAVRLLTEYCALSPEDGPHQEALERALAR